jgi:hypothetical protein
MSARASQLGRFLFWQLPRTQLEEAQKTQHAHLSEREMELGLSATALVLLAAAFLAWGVGRWYLERKAHTPPPPPFTVVTITSPQHGARGNT